MLVAELGREERLSTSPVENDDRPRLWTSSQWLAHFQHSAANRRAIPWEQSGSIAPEELALITRSLQSWQKGETSDGNNLRAAAAKYAKEMSDPVFPDVAELFIREEQGHGELMGQWLDRAGPGRLTSDLGERIFRSVRYLRCDMESWTAPVIVVEVLAMVYYDALRKATTSPSLRTICSQMLADEVPHLRFQAERFALWFHKRSPRARKVALLKQRSLFLAGVLAVWAGHRQVLRAGGYDWKRYWRAAWKHMDRVCSMMEPERYAW